MPFWMQPDDPMHKYQDLVEKILEELGVDPAAARQPSDDPRVRFSWSLRLGSAAIFLDLLEEEGEGMLRLDSPILMLPPKDRREEFYAWLLQLNYNLAESALCLKDDEVHIVCTRPLEDLDPGEVRDLVTRLSNYADDLDNALNVEFDAPLWKAE